MSTTAWKLVPVEPTEVILDAMVKGTRANLSYEDAADLWREGIDASPASPSPTSPADVADYRHRCARSGLHAHDGCACTDADLIRRYAPTDAAWDTTSEMSALPSSDGSRAQPPGAVASLSADDVEGLIAQSRKSAILLRAMATNYARGHSVDSLDISAFQCAANNQDDLAAALSRLQAELDAFTKAGIIEVSVRNQSVSDYMRHWEGRALAAEARLAEVTAERDFERGERRRVSDLCDETEHERAVAVASAATMREALTRADRKLSAYVGVCNGDKELTDTVLPMVRAALGGQHGK